MKKLLILLIIILGSGSIYLYLFPNKKLQEKKNSLKTKITPSVTISAFKGLGNLSFGSFSISSLKNKSYPGSKITIEQKLSPGDGYQRYIASYQSEGLKIFALLTVPDSTKPPNGYPVIVFNHGYVDPPDYSTENSYSNYVDSMAKDGYITFKPDLRGNGKSQGQATQNYISPDYISDSMNAISSIKEYKDANGSKIGVWGHSLGGYITLTELVISKDIKAAVIWNGVVGTYSQLFDWYSNSNLQNSTLDGLISWIVSLFGTPSSNKSFWNSIDPNSHLQDVSAPVQIDVGLSDESLPVSFSKNFYERLKEKGKTVQYIEYPGEGHFLNGPLFPKALQNTRDFFNKYLKSS